MSETKTKINAANTSNGLRRLNVGMFVFFALILVSSVSVFLGSAASVTNRKDTLSNQSASSVSDHAITFNLTGSNTFATGEQIAIDFPETSAFTNGGTWVTSDFAFNDGTARTISTVAQGPGTTTAACADGVNSLGVAVDTTALVFRFIPCGASYTASATGAFITATISGQSPDGSLTNPSAAGSYTIDLLDAAGDCLAGTDDCTFAVAIVDSATVGVTAIISSICGNSIIETGETCDDGNTTGGDGCSATCQTEGGGGPPPDTTPPIISNIQSTDITSTGATITWNTNESSDSTVNYGLTATYGSQSYNAGLVLSHSRALVGLDEGTLYHFQVCSKDGSNNQSCSADQTFTTTDTTPPSITDVVVSGITADSAVVTWNTTENATRYVEYGEVAGPPYASTTGVDAPLQTSHSVNLTGLDPNTTYHYRVRSGDASDNESITLDATFTTLDPSAPVISDVTVTSITGTSATVTWTTNEPTSQHVDYDTVAGPPYSSTTGTDAPLQTSHSVNLTGLDPDTVYHFSVRSSDASANEASTANATFSTLDDSAPVISNVTATSITPNGATITWDTNEGADSVVEYGQTASYGSTESIVEEVTSHSVDLTSLTPNTEYHFRVKSTDDSANESVSAGFTFTTTIPAAPSISDIQVTNITESGARITWTTSSDADSAVDYGTTPAYGSFESNGTLETGHLIVLTGLSQGTEHNYRITSEDAYNQTVTSANLTFTTLSDSIPPANVSGLTATPGDAQVDLSWANPVDADFAGVIILRKTTAYPTNPTDGDVVYDGAGESTSDTAVTNGVAYYYTVFAYDGVPNYSSGAIATATPVGPPDTTAPGDVTGLTATPGYGQVQLSWTNPVDPDLVGVQIVRKTGSAPTGPTDGTIVYAGPDESRVDAGLTNGTEYFYAAYAYDAVPNYSSGVQISATPVAPPDTTAPGPVTGFVATASDAQVQLVWTNPTDPDYAGTRVVRKIGSAPTGPSDGTIVFDGVGDNRLDTFVSNGTTYYYGAYAYDAQLNFAVGAFDSATPSEDLPPPPPLACTDSDGGKNYSVNGTVTSGGQSHTDFCADATSVEEHFCSGGVNLAEQHFCGAGFKCSAGACVPDTFEPTPETCGNGICAVTENSISCPADCPVTPFVPPVEPESELVPEDEHLILPDLRFHATVAKIPLIVVDNRITTYVGMAYTVKIPDESIFKPIRSAYVNSGNSSYAMSQTASFEAVVAAPSEPGITPFSVVVNYEDGTSDKIDAEVRAVPRSVVYETKDGQRVAVPGARVALFSDNGGGNYGLWDGSASGQTNPTTTDANGSFGFIVPTGNYQIRIEKEGYSTFNSLPFPQQTSVISQEYRIIALPEEILDVAVFAADIVAEKTLEIVDNVFVEEGSREVAAPAAVAVAVANVATASAATATAVPYALYLWSFISHPALLFGRRKRKQWGIVYDAHKKLPVDLAIVRLLDAATDRVVRSAVTDKEGRYFFIVQPGEYKLQVAKAGYVFPSDSLKHFKEDGKFVDLYHGEKISVKQETSITANIPVDSTVAEKSSRRVLLEGVGRMLQKGMGVISIIAMVVVFVITPSVLIGLLLLGNLAMYLAFRRLAVTKKPKNWGIVYDDKTGKPLQNVVARIFETKYNKLLETQVTDTRGRYAFLVGSNVYYVTFEKPGFTKEEKGPLDMKGEVKAEEGVDATEAKIVAVDVRLGASSERAPVPPSAPPKQPETKPQDAASEPPKAAQEEEEPSKAEPEPSAASKAEKPSETEEFSKPKVPWELQVIQGMKNKENEVGSSSESKETLPEPDSNKGSAEPVDNQEKDSPEVKVPWELQMLRDGRKQATEEPKPDKDQEDGPPENLPTIPPEDQSENPEKDG